MHHASTLHLHVCRRLLLMLTVCLLLGSSGQLGSAPDHIATRVAIEKAVAASLTAESALPTCSQALRATLASNAVATGVAVQRAVAATLTAEQKALPTATDTATLTTSTPDLVAAGVAIHKAIAATLTAGAPSATSTSAPSTPVASPTSSPRDMPEQTTATPSPAMPDCIWWNEVQAHLGSHQCVCGVVTETYADPNSTAFFIDFDSGYTGYYAVSFNLTFAGLEGSCVRICGVVELYGGRPQTIIGQLDQLQELDTCP